MKKKDIRALYQSKRLELSPTIIEERSQIICHTLFSNFQLCDKFVSLFLPIEKKKEINTYYILEKGISLDVKFAFPKVISQNKLSHILYDSQSQLVVSKWGIPEPQSGKKISVDKLDYIIVPLLAFDMQGNRVGYGKGFYDELLKSKTANCISIGISFFDESTEIDDLNKYDVKLDYCITPNRLIKF